MGAASWLSHLLLRLVGHLGWLIAIWMRVMTFDVRLETPWRLFFQEKPLVLGNPRPADERNIQERNLFLRLTCQDLNLCLFCQQVSFTP